MNPDRLRNGQKVAYFLSGTAKIYESVTFIFLSAKKFSYITFSHPPGTLNEQCGFLFSTCFPVGKPVVDFPFHVLMAELPADVSAPSMASDYTKSRFSEGNSTPNQDFQYRYMSPPLLYAVRKTGSADLRFWLCKARTDFPVSEMNRYCEAQPDKKNICLLEGSRTNLLCCAAAFLQYTGQSSRIFQVRQPLNCGADRTAAFDVCGIPG